MTPLISSAQLAAKLGVSRQQVWNLSARDAVPFYKVGRSQKYDLDEVLKVLKKDKRRGTHSEGSCPLSD